MASIDTRYQSNAAFWHVVQRKINLVGAQPTNLHQLNDSVMSTWSKNSEEFLEPLVESVPQAIKAFLKGKGCPTQD